MPRYALGLLGIVVLTIFTATTAKQGCQDLIRAHTHLSYYPIRDMRTSVGVAPQKIVMRAPDDASVPTTGRDVPGEEPPYEKNQLRLNPVAADDSSIARGERKFMRTCAPCHGKTLAGDGPVVPNYMQPPDLLAEATRQRKDGFIYSYIRFGGVVMPPYGAQVTAEEAWNLVNFIRHMQKTSPR
ncbi:MAG TPA: cytochrome c [Candidatus Eisenbacteria bacterium]|jgi:mono/diheme cytochrome c family protein